MKYQRILLKLSGEALMGNQTHGIDSELIDNYAKEIKRFLIKTLKLLLSLAEETYSEESPELAKEWIECKQIIWEC